MSDYRSTISPCVCACAIFALPCLHRLLCCQCCRWVDFWERERRGQLGPQELQKTIQFHEADQILTIEHGLLHFNYKQVISEEPQAVLLSSTFSIGTVGNDFIRGPTLRSTIELRLALQWSFPKVPERSGARHFRRFKSQALGCRHSGTSGYRRFQALKLRPQS